MQVFGYLVEEGVTRSSGLQVHVVILIRIFEHYYSVPVKSPNPLFKPGFRTSFHLVKITIFRKLGILPVGKKTLEKVRLIVNSISK